jgi:hypothetical protein
VVEVEVLENHHAITPQEFLVVQVAVGKVEERETNLGKIRLALQ